MSDPRTAGDYAAAQRAEWSTYVAKVAIDYYGVRAYNRGDPVPVSAVEGDAGWVDPAWVDRSDDVFAGSATVVDPAPPVVDPGPLAAPPASTPDVPPGAAADTTTITSTEG
jgi:hypothetical protein